MKISRRIAIAGTSAGLAIAALAAPASAVDFASMSSINKELDDRYNWIPCGILESTLTQGGVLEEGQYNRELAEAITAKGEGWLTAQYPQVGAWNADQAAAIADRAQVCGLVKEDTYISELSSTLSS